MIIGISSSLVATTMFIAASEFARRILLPWYADKLYRGVRIDGTWTKKSEFPGSELKKETTTLILMQKGDRIFGTFSFRTTEEQKVEIYNVEGIIRDGIFTAMMRSRTSYHLDAITILSRISCPSDKLEMKGAISYLDQASVNVESNNQFHFYRNES